MVRVINIDTKTRTIRVSNGKDDLEWFTTDTGSHVPLKKGQSKAEAIKEHFGDKKQKPQLERLEKMGKAWGKDQMSVLRELGKTNPQGLKDELDRIDAERKRTTKVHKEWLKEKASKQPAKKDDDIMSWPFHKAMELPGDDPRLVQYLKAHHAKWKAAKENDKIETIKDKIIDGLTEGVYSQDYTQLVAKELDEEIAETEKQSAKQDKGIEEEYLAEINRLEQKSQHLRKMGQGRSATKIDEQVFKLQKELAKAMGYGGAKAKQQPAKQDKDIEEVGEWPKSPKFEKLTKQYMPKQGEADTELGEILRSINRVVYRYYNDGDMWNKGYGKETVNGAIKHLTELSKNKETPRYIARGLDNALFELKKHGVKDKDKYETALKMMLQTMEWADEKEIEALSKMKRNTEKQP